ncbi:MAG: hypothetical protein R2909_15460 [Gemmatimonadales bacterium]
MAIYLKEEEGKLMRALRRSHRLELDLRDDPTVRADDFRLVSRPSGRDVTETYAVA